MSALRASEGGKSERASEGVCTYLHKSRILPGVSPSPFERRLPPSLDLISATHHPITGADNGLVPQILACAWAAAGNKLRAWTSLLEPL